MKNEETIAVLNTLIQINNDRIEGYDTASNCLLYTSQFSEYHNRNGVVIPILGKVTWLLEKGDFCYARFRVKTIKYDWIKS